MTLSEARRALQSNATLINSEKHKVAWNTNSALLNMCDALDRLERDVALLHSKLQPILKELIEDQHDWQSHTRGD
jgi:hypothetical protein